MSNHQPTDIKLTSAMVNVAASDATIKVLTKNLPKNQ